VIKKDPKYIKAYILKAEILMETDLADAKDILTAILEFAPKSF
jgi:Tfp pilus assembly protein PilF